MSLTIGSKAPAINALNQNGETVTLDQYKGRKVVLYFYPKDSTPGCTAQACNLRDNYPLLLENGFVVIGVSADDQKSHQRFVQKNELPFDLLIDTDLKIINDYGVWQEKSMYGRTYMGIVRTTFVLDEEGIITEIIEKVKTKDHSNQIIK